MYIEESKNIKKKIVLFSIFTIFIDHHFLKLKYFSHVYRIEKSCLQNFRIYNSSFKILHLIVLTKLIASSTKTQRYIKWFTSKIFHFGRRIYFSLKYYFYECYLFHSSGVDKITGKNNALETFKRIIISVYFLRTIKCRLRSKGEILENPELWIE